MDEIEKHQELFGEVCTLIEGSRYRLATAVNAEVCLLHWNVGSRIKTETLNNQRAAYGKEVMKNLAVLLTEKYGKGWGYEKPPLGVVKAWFGLGVIPYCCQK